MRSTANNGRSHMAKKDNGQPAETAQPSAPPTAADDRHRLVTLDGNYGEKAGTKVKRADFIRDMWVNQRWSRGQITKEINRLNKASGDKEIKYQIVFAATK